MKRFLSILVVLVLVPLAIASAAGSSAREALEFYGLYVRRHEALCELLSENTRTLTASLFGNRVYLSGGKTEISTALGDIIIDNKTHTVSEVSVMYLLMSDSADQFIEKSVNAMAVVSALEYTEAEEIKSMDGYSSKLSALKAMDIWKENFNDSVQAAILKASKDETLVYSGNYNYYISFFQTSDGEKVFFLTARAK